MKRFLAALAFLAAVSAGAQTPYSGPISDRVISKNAGLAVPAGYFVIQDEGVNLAFRTTLNMIGAGVSCADNAGAGTTDCTIAGGGGGAPTGATYITQTPDGTLSAEQALSALGTGLVKNTTGTGVLSIYAGNTCTNQFARSDTASGVWTCASIVNGDITNTTIDLTTKVTGLLPLANLANGSNISVLGRSANSSGVMAPIQCTAASDAVLRESGSVLGCGTIATAGIGANQVTLPKLATQAAYTAVGNDTSATATPTAIAGAGLADLLFQDNSVFYLNEEWMSGCSSSGSCGQIGWRADFDTTGNDVTVDDGQGRPGVISITTGTNAAGRTSLYLEDTGQTGSIRVGGSVVWVIKMNVKFPTLSDGVTERYKARLGMLRGPNTVTSGIWFEYDETTSGQFWRICSAVSSSTTCTASTTAVTANTWMRLEIQVNSAGTSIAYLVDGAAVNVSPLSTNIPTTVGVAPAIEIIKTAGTTARTMFQDYYKILGTGLSSTR